MLVRVFRQVYSSVCLLIQSQQVLLPNHCADLGDAKLENLEILEILRDALDTRIIIIVASN